MLSRHMYLSKVRRLYDLRSTSGIAPSFKCIMLVHTLIILWVQGSKVFSIQDLALDMQRLILGLLPLRQLAQLGCLSKELRNLYWERVEQRDVVIASKLETHFTAEFRENLRPEETSLPRDLVVDPPVRDLSVNGFISITLPAIRS
jgi:hypothetical protein